MYTDSHCQLLRKCIENSTENIHTDIKNFEIFHTFGGQGRGGCHTLPCPPPKPSLAKSWFTLLFFQQFTSNSKFVPGEHRHVKLTLCFRLPMRQTARIVGHHLSNSDIQLANVDFGKITRWGPAISLKCFMYPSKEMVCKVLPRPCYNKKN